MEYSVTEPIREFARRRRLSPQTVYNWADKGLIETFLLDHRRHVVVASYDRLVQRLITEQAGTKLPDPIRKQNPRAAHVTRNGAPRQPTR